MKDSYQLYLKWCANVGYLLVLCGKYPISVHFNLCDHTFWCLNVWTPPEPEEVYLAD